MVQLQAFLLAASGHRLFPALWLSAMTGVRRSGLLWLQRSDIAFKTHRVSIDRGLVAVGYELHESRGKTANARRDIDLDPTTITVLRAWRALQAAEYGRSTAATRAEGSPTRMASRSTPTPSPRPSSALAAGPRGWRAVKVVSERLGLANIAFTIETYQHVPPGMHATPPVPTRSSPHRAFYRPSATR